MKKTRTHCTWHEQHTIKAWHFLFLFCLLSLISSLSCLSLSLSCLLYPQKQKQKGRDKPFDRTSKRQTDGLKNSLTVSFIDNFVFQRGRKG